MGGEGGVGTWRQGHPRALLISGLAEQRASGPVRNPLSEDKVGSNSRKHSGLISVLHVYPHTGIYPPHRQRTHVHAHTAYPGSHNTIKPTKSGSNISELPKVTGSGHHY